MTSARDCSPDDPVVEDDGLFSVGSDALPERLLARKPVIESGDAALVRDDPAGYALDSAAENCWSEFGLFIVPNTIQSLPSTLA